MSGVCHSRSFPGTLSDAAAGLLYLHQDTCSARLRLYSNRERLKGAERPGDGGACTHSRRTARVSSVAGRKPCRTGSLQFTPVKRLLSFIGMLLCSFLLSLFLHLFLFSFQIPVCIMPSSFRHETVSNSFHRAWCVRSASITCCLLRARRSGFGRRCLSR